MFKRLPNIFLIVLLHVAIGFALTYPFVAVSFVHILYGAAFLHVYISRNRENQALYWSMYLVSSEVLFRMTDGLILYESIKYMVILLLVLGILLEKEKRPIPIIYILYLLILSVGIVFSEIPAGESMRKAIAFNLSGPVVLGISAIYMFQRRFKIEQLALILFIGSLPVVAMLSFLFLRTPDFSEIQFTTESNLETSGGFGPNQVATILGFGMFAIASLIIIRKRLTNYLVLDIIILMYVTYRGLLTFSRGGMITAFIALISVAIFFILSQKYVFYNTIKYFVLAFVLGIGVWLYTSGVTGGMIDNRYSNKSARGEKVEDASSGRSDIIKTDFQYFYENPIFGIGVGSGKYKRMYEETEEVTAASHNEIGRLLSEHGSLGLISLMVLMIAPVLHFLKLDNFNKGFVLAFYIFWFLTINHSAMRIAFPGFIYGLSLITILHEKKE